jgi:hypothetical protein
MIRRTQMNDKEKEIIRLKKKFYGELSTLLIDKMNTLNEMATLDPVDMLEIMITTQVRSLAALVALSENTEETIASIVDMMRLLINPKKENTNEK